MNSVKHVFLLTITALALAMSQASSLKAKDSTPDTYLCKPDMCNTCGYKVRSLLTHTASVADGGCTEMGCASSPEIAALFKQCAQDWRYSKHISFKAFSPQENQCVNAVRNHNFWEDSYPRQPFDKSYAFAQCLEHHHRIYEKRYSQRVSDICQNEWKDFVPSEEVIFLKNAERSAAIAHQQCAGYFEMLEKELGFASKELDVLARYLVSRQFPAAAHSPRVMVSGKQVSSADILKNIFDTLNKKQWVNHNMVVTPAAVATFMQQDKDAPKQ